VLLRLGLLGGSCLLLFGWSRPAPTLRAEAAAPRNRPTAKLFRRLCVQCHGKDGRGAPGRRTMPAIPNFTLSSWQQSRSNPQLAVSIMEGKNRQMPANRGRVTDQQVSALVAYIRTFGPTRSVRSQPHPKAGSGQAGQPGDSPLSGSTDFAAEFNKLQREWDGLQRQSKELARQVEREVKQPSPAAEEVPGKSVATRSRPSEPARFFRRNCTRCHTIGGGARTGPDLKDVGSRRERDWLVRFLQNPKALIDRGDPYALGLKAAARGVIMPHTFGITQERAENLLDFIEAESQRPKSEFAAQPIPERPFTPEEAARGRDLFSGRRPLANGGPACIACHAVHDGRTREGGRLGPDLTKAYERLGGRTALTGRLWATGTPTMLPVYQQHPLEQDEALALAAYLEETNREGVEDTAGFPLNFFLLGLGGTVLGLLAFNFLWGRRLGPGGRPGLNAMPAAALPAAGGLLPRRPGWETEGGATATARPDLGSVPEDYVAPGL
jgi:mono/diheme cytochrome c family protein